MKSMQTKSGGRAPVVPSLVSGDDLAEVRDERRNFIATAAYYKALARGFKPGGEVDDWLQAEAEFQEQKPRH